MFKSKGIYYALITAVISGFSIFLNSFAVKAVGKNPYQFTTLKNLVVAFVLILVVLSPQIFGSFKKISKRDWLNLIIIGVIGGSIPFLLFFKGLSLASSTSAAFIHKTLFIWVAFLAAGFLKEKVTKLQLFALTALLFGTWFLDGFSSFNFGLAEGLVFVATLFWSLEYVIAKKVLEKISPLVVAWARMFFGVIIMIGFLLVSGNFKGMFALKISQLPWLVIPSVLLLSYVVAWYTALKHEKATVVTSVLVLGSLITTALNTIFVSHSFTAEKMLWCLIMALGVVVFNLAGNLKYQPIKSSVHLSA